MRAWAVDRYGEIASLTLRELPRPEPKANELLIEVHAIGLNPSDIKVLTGRESGRFLHAGSFPLIGGNDFSGVVAEAGPEARGHAVGDEVFGFLPFSIKNRAGTFADYVCCAADSVGMKAKGISHEEAAASGTAAITALQAMRDEARLKPGQSVLINGASGGVGVYAVQIAKCLGAEASGLCSAGKADQVLELGAVRVYDYATTRADARGISQRFDMFFDVAANASSARAMSLLKPGGAFVTLVPSAGMLLGWARAAFSSQRCTFLICQPRAADLNQLTTWFDEGKLKPVLERALPFAELKRGLQELHAGKVRGKLAVSVRA